MRMQGQWVAERPRVGTTELYLGSTAAGGFRLNVTPLDRSTIRRILACPVADHSFSTCNHVV